MVEAAESQNMGELAELKKNEGNAALKAGKVDEAIRLYSAAIVRMDDTGLALMRRDSTAARALGRFLVRALPLLIKAIGAVGTAALILVSGGIFVHHLPFVHDFLHALPDLAAEILAGLSIGLLALGVVALFKSARSKPQ